MELKKLAVHDLHIALGAKMVPFAGYEMPLRYTSEMEEHKTVRSGAGIFDVSHMGEFFVEGPDALPLIQRLTCNDASKLRAGQAQYSCLMNPQGGIVDDLLVYRLGDDRFMLVVNAANIEKDWNWIAQNKGSLNPKLTNASEQYCLFAVQGPLAKNLLQELAGIDLAAIKYYTFAIGELAGVTDLIISATGYTGSGGFEIYVPHEHAKTLWEKIMEAGRKHGLKPVGLGARNTLRLEMGFCLYGADLNDQTTPLEAGLSWIVKLEKEFIGSAKLAAQKKQGPEKVLVGFEMIDKGIPREGYEIFNEQKEKVGEVSSGSLSPSLGVGIGMGYVKKAFAEIHTKLLINVRNKFLTAEVVKMPFYKKR